MTAHAKTTTEQFLQKMKLIASIHEKVFFNVEHVEQKQKKTYVTKRGKQTFKGLVVRQTMVKMKKPGKKKALISSWEGPYQFVVHADGIRNLRFEEGNKICIIKDVDGN